MSELLPVVLASVPSLEMALDGAVSLIAGSQFASLAPARMEKGDAAAYSAGIEGLAMTFPRGCWTASTPAHLPRSFFSSHAFRSRIAR